MCQTSPNDLIRSLLYSPSHTSYQNTNNVEFTRLQVSSHLSAESEYIYIPLRISNIQQPHLMVESRVPEALTFQDFPPEIIGEVFLHSLPDNVLEQRQPSVRIAPMLLCQVCSKWRSIALQLPQLWMRLFHVSHFSNRGDSGIFLEGIRSSDLEFLAWWRSNLGENPLHLCFYIGEPICRCPINSSTLQKQILVALFAFVRHLELDLSAVRAIGKRTRVDGRKIFPRLETLRINAEVRPVVPIFSEYPIRKLHINRLYLWDWGPDAFKIFPWSSLTHVVFNGALLLSGMWFDLFRACVNLQSGYFKLYTMNPRELGNPARRTHHHLRQLAVAWDVPLGHGQYLLRNVFLPSLTALRISTSLTAEHLHCILESTPSLVELHLGCEVAVAEIWDSPSTSGVLDPLSKYVPNLQYLVIQANFSIYETMGLVDLIVNLLTSTWLQLGEPTNNVRKLDIRFVGANPNEVRQQLNYRIVLNPHGLEVAIMHDYQPIYWTSSTPFEKREAEYFENTEFWSAFY